MTTFKVIGDKVTKDKVLEGSMSEVDILERAWSKINSPEKWCQEFYGLDALNRSVFLDTKEAVKFCAEGALMCARKESGEDVDHQYFVVNGLDAQKRLIGAAYVLYNRDVMSVNDTIGYEAVKNIYDMAILGARGELEWQKLKT